jgi:hypothetical protein
VVAEKGVGDMIEKLGITPGPWEYYCEKQLVTGSTMGDYTLFFETVRARGENLCRMHNAPDARIIAASPNMLETLVKNMRDFETINSFCLDNGLPTFDRAERETREAVEKATGKTWEEVKELRGC